MSSPWRFPPTTTAVPKDAAEFPCEELPPPINSSPGGGNDNELLLMGLCSLGLRTEPLPRPGSSSCVAEGSQDWRGKRRWELCQHARGEQR